jgi:RNA polymerase sigma factor (sigma-70 family)
VPGIPSRNRPQDAAAPGRHDSLADLWHLEFEACYKVEMPLLIRFLMKCGANEHDAADAAQNAFFALFQQWATVRYPKSWLRRVAFRMFLRQPVTGKSPVQEHHELPGVLSASTRIELAEEEQVVIAAFRQLPATQRQVFALHYDKFTTREITGILQMKEAAVRQNIARARVTLKELLRFTGQAGQPPG